jgi:hypothetical protein
MGGSYLKIKTKGQQDEFLTTNPTKNFFIKSYERYSDFSVQREKVYFTENVDFGKRITLNFPKQADLLHKTYFCFTLPALTYTNGSYAGWTNSIGHYIIDTIDLEIENQLVSRYYGLYMEIWEELNGENPNENPQIGKYGNIETLQSSGLTSSDYVVPLPFWFCKGIHTALPLVSLFYQNVKLSIRLKPFSQCVIYDGTLPPSTVKITDAYILADYIFLDEVNRIKMKSIEKDILIEQVQYKDSRGSDSSSSSGVFKTDLPFNHPVKELLWVFIEDASLSNNDGFNFSGRNAVPNTKVVSLMKNAKLVIDGKDYIDTKNEIIFRLVNEHKNKTDRHIFTLSFCEDPELWEPSGSLNFSRIDNPELQGDMNVPTPYNSCYVFARNHNWLSISNGLCSLKFIA